MGVTAAMSEMENGDFSPTTLALKGGPRIFYSRAVRKNAMKIVPVIKSGDLQRVTSLH